MIAEFYLVNDSFKYQNGITIDDLTEKIKNLAADCAYIRQYKDTNRQLRYVEIYDAEIYANMTVADFLYNPLTTKNTFDRDVIIALQNIIDKASETQLSNDDIAELLDTHDENSAYGLLCLHKIDAINGILIKEPYLVYNQQNWLVFRRYFLGLYPKDTAFFYQETKIYFPKLYLHERNIQTMRPIYNDFVKKIIYHLACLNDHFHEYKNIPYERITTLKQFSKLLDAEASNQGNASVKKLMTFSFKNNENKMEDICCEPHLKLCHSDKFPGDSNYYQYRIYFHEGKSKKTEEGKILVIQEGKILVGHIGEHL